MARKKTLTHLDRDGLPRMVDVSRKAVTLRRAVATAELRMKPATLQRIRQGSLPKGSVSSIARIAAIQAAKETHRWIPLCHPLPLESIDVDIVFRPPDRVAIKVRTQVRARTGVEMEALVGASAAALAIYDMCKAIDRGVIIGPIQLQEKSGGRSGSWKREDNSRKLSKVVKNARATARRRKHSLK
jgi:cyclic pyranopterin phosphate synthase